jgi:hypothetical protein
VAALQELDAEASDGTGARLVKPPMVIDNVPAGNILPPPY